LFGRQFHGFVARENLNSSIQTFLVFILRLAVLRNLRYVLIIGGTDAKRHWSGEAVQVFFVFRVLVIGFAILMIQVRPVGAQEPTHRVLLLYPYDDAAVFTQIAGAEIRKRLVEKYRTKIEIHAVFLDLARFPAETDELRSAHYLAEKYAGKLPDIIMPLGTVAERFAVKYRDIIAPKAPIVFCCVAPELANGPGRSKDVTGNYRAFDAGKTIALARQLQPSAKNLIIISGSSEIDGRWLAEQRKGIDAFENRINTEYWVGVRYETLLERVAHLPPETIVIFVTVYGDNTGRSFMQAEAVEGLVKVATAPIYGPSETYFGRGIVGGYMDSFASMGSGAADMALEVLAGKDPNAIDPRPSPDRTFQVDARQLARWKLSKTNLPEGTVLFFKDLSLWEEHRNLVLATIFVILLQASLITALLIQIMRRKRAETASRVALSDLARVSRLTTIGEMTASIAHEINQPLGAIVTNGEAGLRWLANATPDLDEVRAALTRIVGNGHRAGDVIGRIRVMLKKDVGERVLLDLNELVEEVLIFVRGEIDEHGVVLQTQLQGGLPKIFADRIQLQQVMLNLVLNGIDAMTSVVDRERILTLRSERGDGSTVIFFSVEDAGKGIGTDIKERIFEAFFTTKSHGMGMGLSICRSIIGSHGGRLLVSAAQPYGTVFRVELPVHRSGAA
jgi:signal transduction histidine kinase